jgi:hypothetical protein
MEGKWGLESCMVHKSSLFTVASMNNSSACVLCNTETETSVHLFLVCADSIACWKSVNLCDILENLMASSDGFEDY